METKSFITKEYLLNALAEFNKIVANSQYYDKTKGENLSTSFSDFKTNITNTISNSSKLDKVIVTDVLCDANEAKDNAIYIVKDDNSKTEACNYFVYTIRTINNVKKWICISAPSTVFEDCDSFSFSDEYFEEYKKQYISENTVYYLSWSALKEDIDNSGVTISYNGKTFNCLNIVDESGCIAADDDVVFVFSSISNYVTPATDYYKSYSTDDTDSLRTLAQSTPKEVRSE